MNPQRFNNSLNESSETKRKECYLFTNNNTTDFDVLIMEKHIALSSLDYLGDEVDRLEEEDNVSRKIRKINSNCFLVSCLSESDSEIYDINDSTNDFQTNLIFQ